MRFKLVPMILSLTMIFTVSCSKDFTLLAPHSLRNVDNFYATQTDIDIAVNGIYDALQSGGTYGTNSGLATGGAGGYWMLSEMRSDNTNQGGDVSGLAASIAVVNQFKEDPLNEYVLGAWVGSYQGIARANVVLSNIDDVDMSQALNDQYTGEALFLRSLFYYNLALLYGNVPMPLTETVSVDDNLAQVDAAAVFAQITADLVKSASLLDEGTTAASGGRATKGAAQTLLAKVYLQTGDKASATTVLAAIIASGVYSLEATYAGIWDGANPGESIFEVQYQGGGFGEGSGYANTFAPSGDVVGQGSSGGRNRATADLMDSFEAGDLRYIGSMDTTYLDISADTMAITEFAFTTKYLSVPFGNFDGDDNFIVFRYADVLLMHAEATGAYTHINTLRTRGGLADVTSATGAGYADFDAFLLHERRVELAFENHRWYDLLRLSSDAEVISIMTAQLAEEGYTAPTATQLLFAIPQREVDLGLIQNPGY